MVHYNEAVIARYEAIARKPRGYANPPCTVGDCFVPRNDVVFI
jgi:hypothetical protein